MGRKRIYVRKLPLEKRRELRQQALKMRKMGFSIREIASTLGISKGTIEGWIYKNRNPENLFNIPSLKPSKELAYVLGVLVGDGCVTRGGKGTYVVKLRTASRIFANKFKEHLEKIGLSPSINVERRSKINPKWKDIYVVRAVSKIFYDFYKSLDLNKIRQLIRGFEIEFLQGFYESEGSLDFRKRYKHLRIRIVNTNYELLKLVRNIIETHLNIRCNLRKRRGTKKTAFEILIEGNTPCRTFLEIVKPCIKNSVEEDY